MSRSTDIGAPSLTGKGANELIASAFAGAVFPLQLRAKNHMPHDVVFPEVGGDGLFLRHVASANGSEAVVAISSIDVLQRLGSSVEQIAELNRYPVAMSLSEALDDAELVSDDVADESIDVVVITDEVVVTDEKDGADDSAGTETLQPDTGADKVADVVADTAGSTPPAAAVTTETKSDDKRAQRRPGRPKKTETK